MKGMAKLIFLALLTISPIQGMQAVKRATHIDMNQGMWIHVPAHSEYTLWTDGLCGCIATIIDIEHINGNHSICMCHCSYEAQGQNKQLLEAFLKTLDVKTIRKAICTLLPPSIHKKTIGTSLMPIIDPVWKNLIISTVKKYIPTIKIVIKPYLFNELTSEVRYSFSAGSTALQIIDKSSTIDEESIQQLLETHNYPNQDTQYTAALLPLVAASVIGLYYYYFMS